MLRYLILPIGILAFSSSSILIKICDAPAMVIATYRLSFASLFFILAAGVRKINPLKEFNKRDLLLAGFSGMFLCLHFSAWIISLNYTSVASSVVLVSTSPIFVAIGSIIFLKEKPSKFLVWGILFTLIGAVIISFKESGAGRTSLQGNALALLGAVGISGYYLIGRFLRAKISTFSYVAVVYTITALILIIITSAMNHSLLNYERETYFLFFLIAFVPQVIGHTTLNWALKLFSATTVAMITLSEPIGASILAFLLLGEKVAATQMMGGILILAGLAIALRGEVSKNERPPPHKSQLDCLN